MWPSKCCEVGAEISLDCQHSVPKNDNNGVDAYSHRAVSTLNGIEEMRHSWEELQSRSGRCLQTDIDYYLAEIASKNGASCPHVIVLYKNGAPVSALIGTIEDAPFELRLGYKVLFQPKVRLLKFDHPPTIGDDSHAACKRLLSVLKDSLTQFKIDVITFKNIKCDSHMYEVASACIYPLIRRLVLPQTKRWMLLLPESYEVFYSTRSKHIKRNTKQGFFRLTRDFPDTVMYKRFSQKSELDVAMSHVEAVARKAWQRRMGLGFFLDDRHRARYRSSIAHGWLRIYVINIKDEPVAFWIVFRYGNTMTIEYTGYNPEFSNYTVGSILLMKMIEELCSDSDISVVDYGPGPDTYKSLYGNQSWDETQVYLFAHSSRGLAFNVIWSALGIVSHVGKALLRYLNLETKMRNLWFNRLKGGKLSKAGKPESN